MSNGIGDGIRQLCDRPWQRARARGCMLGQFCGDALGGLVEFQSSDQIRSEYPNGVRNMADGGPFNTIAGQPTDDSEMALMLARSLVADAGFDRGKVRRRYREWLESGPFDCGNTIWKGLSGERNFESQANGALMRISPLGIFGAGRNLDDVAEWARQDASITHPNPVCQQANALFAMAIATAVGQGIDGKSLHDAIVSWAVELNVDPALRKVVEAVDQEPWINRTVSKAGWVLVALQNAMWQLVNAPDLEAAIIDTANRGGDSDTNAAICGALLGSVYGIDALPERWVNTVLNCRPEAGKAGVRQPRPEKFWPVDAMKLADELLAV
ncbi:MAG: ADP-ribosylglycohydrolase family protein [Rhodobacteraceae bacterium]|nr:ADP-ribosylglycohydrolase family protein [Paracoccaceae bacterium]